MTIDLTPPVIPTDGDICFVNGTFKIYVRNYNCDLSIYSDPRDCRERGKPESTMCFSCRYYGDSTMWVPFIESLHAKRNKPHAPVIRPVKEEKKKDMNHIKYIDNVQHTYVKNKSCEHITACFGSSPSSLDCREAHRYRCSSCARRDEADMWKSNGTPKRKPKKTATKNEKPVTTKKPKPKKPAKKFLTTTVTLPSKTLSIEATGEAIKGPTYQDASKHSNKLTAHHLDRTGEVATGDMAGDDIIELEVEDAYGAFTVVRFNVDQLRNFFEALFT